MNIGDRIIHVLSEYRCTYTVDANGDGLELIDVLSNSSDDVSSGGQECDLLADDIHRAVTDYIGADDPKPGELARLRAAITQIAVYGELHKHCDLMGIAQEALQEVDGD